MPAAAGYHQYRLRREAAIRPTISPAQSELVNAYPPQVAIRIDTDFYLDPIARIMKLWMKQYPKSYFARVALEFLMPVERLKEYLNKENVRYVTIQHSKAYTAYEIAESAHIPKQELAKTVMLDVDGEMAMMIIPASARVDLERLKEVIGSEDVELAPEGKFKDEFPDCEVGAMPPFGNLYGMKVFVSQALSEDDEIAFNAGSHTELIRLAYQDFERLVRPIPIPL